MNEQKRKYGRGLKDIFTAANIPFMIILIFVFINMYIRVLDNTLEFLLADSLGIAALLIAFIFINPRTMRSNTTDFLRPKLSVVIYKLYILLHSLMSYRAFKNFSSRLMIFLALLFTILSAIVSTLWYNGDFSAPVFLFLTLFFFKRLSLKKLDSDLGGLLLLAWIALIAFAINAIMSGFWYTQINFNLAFISVASFDLYSFMAHTEVFLPRIDR